MKTVIGVMGSAHGDLTAELKEKARIIGAQIARNGYVLATGACPGLPLEAAIGATENNGIVLGFSPAENEEKHVSTYNFPLQPFTAMIFTGFGLKGRAVINIRSCQAVIFISGRIGTLNEFTLAFSEGKIIGVLTETGGFSAELHRMSEQFGVSPKKPIIFETDPVVLVKKVSDNLKK
ncbi:MAG: hypothetical protein WC460_04645 [Patescibacteria group bacterium]